ITPSTALQPIIEVEYNLGRWQFVGYFNPLALHVVLVVVLYALFFTQLHYRTNIFRRRNNAGFNKWFINFIYFIWLRHIAGTVNLYLFLFSLRSHIHLIFYIRYRGNNIDIEFAIQPFLHNLHMQHT